MVRPPCVVKAANSSPNDRCHSGLPSRLSAIASRAAAERVDVAGLRVDGRRGPADAVRRHVALEEVEPCTPRPACRCRRPAPSRARAGPRRGPPGSARRRGCPSRPAPSGRRTARATACPRRSASTCRGRPVSADVPSRLGPRASGQSPTGTRRGPCAASGSTRPIPTASSEQTLLQHGKEIISEGPGSPVCAQSGHNSSVPALRDPCTSYNGWIPRETPLSFPAS